MNLRNTSKRPVFVTSTIVHQFLPPLSSSIFFSHSKPFTLNSTAPKKHSRSFSVRVCVYVCIWMPSECVICVVCNRVSQNQINWGSWNDAKWFSTIKVLTYKSFKSARNATHYSVLNVHTSSLYAVMNLPYSGRIYRCRLTFNLLSLFFAFN